MKLGCSTRLSRCEGAKKGWVRKRLFRGKCRKTQNNAIDDRRLPSWSLELFSVSIFPGKWIFDFEKPAYARPQTA